jgi:hypothetical protein
VGKKKRIARMWGRKFGTASVRKPIGINGPESKCFVRTGAWKNNF